jgi:CheY-like chemotaxis protein
MACPKILYVGHDLPWRKSYKSLLGALGYDVVTAKTGTHALRLVWLDLERVAAVVLDYEMPGVSGHELAANIKLFNPALPVIIVSERESVVQDAPRFVDSALSKSSDLARLVQHLRTVMKDVPEFSVSPALIRFLNSSAHSPDLINPSRP